MRLTLFDEELRVEQNGKVTAGEGLDKIYLPGSLILWLFLGEDERPRPFASFVNSQKDKFLPRFCLFVHSSFFVFSNIWQSILLLSWNLVPQVS